MTLADIYQRPLIIGTAGHIDHGKTTLTQRLTGVNTDRLPEERARGISIDLGFADFTLPSGQHAALIDVPGHERFIRNMVAGVHGMDAVMLVVAADEGIMPQTREHLDILTLLGVSRGLTVITKADTVEPEWLPIVEETVQEALRGSFLEQAPIVTVDSVSGRGLVDLLNALETVARTVPPRDATGFVRLPIDRVFSVRGFGTVITGTLVSGTLRPEDVLEVVPGDHSVRVRGLEVHGHKVDYAVAGQRVAVNLSGIDKDHVHRGQMLAAVGTVKSVDVIVVEVLLLASSPILEQRTRVHVHLGTAEAIGRVYWYDRESLEPGDTAFGEIRLESSIPAIRYDRFLIRSYSPVFTVGGGRVLEAGVHHKRKEAGLLGHLALVASGNTKAVVLEQLRACDAPCSIEKLAERAGYRVTEIETLCQDDPEIVYGPDRQVFWKPYLPDLISTVQHFLGEYHQDHPLRRGIGRERLRDSLWPKWSLRSVLFVVHYAENVVVEGEWVRLADFVPVVEGAWAQEIESVYQAIDASARKPLTVEQLIGMTSIHTERFFDIIDYLLSQKRLVRLEEGIYISTPVYIASRDIVIEALQERGALTTSELRDVLEANRRFAVLFLELLDALHITRRQGESRTLVS
ncbi:selenocysteine-specific translation elongation factor [Sulfobacillus thermotolerans]|uniref:Selenocysteine-specific elongation factor n=1 Tax=Sulfobacillus thermotolerans TaxID=338644 RepID=A0ABM6RQA1_9FIRM|nr:selenocysteine-specific translation elongation factor [Sulfobacillus thermotolerans]